MSVDGDLVPRSTTNMPRHRIIKRHFKFKQKSFKENLQGGSRSMSELLSYQNHPSNNIAKMSLQNDTSFYLSEWKSQKFWKSKQYKQFLCKQRKLKKRNQQNEVFNGTRYKQIINKASFKSSIFNGLPTTPFLCETHSTFDDNLYSFNRTGLWKKNDRAQKEEKELFMVYSVFVNSYIVTCYTICPNTGFKSR